MKSKKFITGPIYTTEGILIVCHLIRNNWNSFPSWRTLSVSFISAWNAISYSSSWLLRWVCITFITYSFLLYNCLCSTNKINNSNPGQHNFVMSDPNCFIDWILKQLFSNNKYTFTIVFNILKSILVSSDLIHFKRHIRCTGFMFQADYINYTPLLLVDISLFYFRSLMDFI